MLTPDGARYLAAANVRVARPFHLRWLLPRLLGTNLRAWTITSRVSIAAIGVLTAVYAHSPWMACVALLPGVMLSWRHPVLVDAPAMALALLSAVLFPLSWPAAVAVAVIAGCVRETAPVWAAIYAWNPLALVGLVPVAIRALMRAGSDVLDEENAWILTHPFKASLKYHAGRWRDPTLMVTPWGGLIVALGGLDVRLGVALAAAYGQLLTATDSVRLYQWAAPVMAVACVQVLPGWALPFVAVSIAVNPWEGPGV